MPPRPHDPAPEQKFLRKVLSVATDGTLMHFRLACGHLITEHKANVAAHPPAAIDCWACRAEKSEHE